MKKKFVNFKMSKKLKITFTGILAAFILFMLVSVISLSNVSGNLKKFYNEAYVITEAAHGTQEAFISIQKTIYQLTSNFDKTEELLEQLNYYSAEFNANFETVSQNFDDKEGLLNEFLSQIKNSQDTRDNRTA